MLGEHVNILDFFSRRQVELGLFCLSIIIFIVIINMNIVTYIYVYLVMTCVPFFLMCMFLCMHDCV